jgi:hypothetical protein
MCRSNDTGMTLKRANGLGRQGLQMISSLPPRRDATLPHDNKGSVHQKGCT